METPTAAAIANRFLAARRTKGLREQTLTWYVSRLRRLPLPRPFADLSPEYMSRRLDAVTARVGLSTRRSYARAWVALWTWARRNGISAQDVAPALYREPTLADSRGAAIISPDDAARILDALAPKLRPAAAVLLFAGLRPQEIRGNGKPALTFGALNVADKILRVPAEVAKTRKWRVLEGLPDALWRFIPPAEQPDKPLCPVSSARLIELMQVAGGFLRPAKGRGGLRKRLRDWPHDGTRHSFATYALALTSDPAKVGLWLGHENNSTMLFRHYRGLTTKAEAERYFAIRPTQDLETDAKNGM